MTHTYICVTWFICMCNMTHLYAWHDSLIRVTWIIAMCDTTYSYVQYDSFVRVIWLNHIESKTHAHIWLVHIWYCNEHRKRQRRTRIVRLVDTASLWIFSLNRSITCVYVQYFSNSVFWRTHTCARTHTHTHAHAHTHTSVVCVYPYTQSECTWTHVGDVCILLYVR